MNTSQYEIVKDEKFDKMWRIKSSDDKISDMANFTRINQEFRVLSKKVSPS